MVKEVHQLKITLRGSKPAIWRRVLVPSNSTLADLHETIRVAMGWAGYHLHEFDIGGDTFGPKGMDEPGLEMLDERSFRLSSVLRGVGVKAKYNYDFGDDWVHNIVVEKILPAETGRAYPVCVDGKMRCPPEDCGGLYGYYELIESLNDPVHGEEALEVLGPGFDPSEFLIDDVNQLFAKPAKARRKK